MNCTLFLQEVVWGRGSNSKKRRYIVFSVTVLPWVIYLWSPSQEQDGTILQLYEYSSCLVGNTAHCRLSCICTSAIIKSGRSWKNTSNLCVPHPATGTNQRGGGEDTDFRQRALEFSQWFKFLEFTSKMMNSKEVFQNKCTYYCITAYLVYSGTV